MHFFGPTHFFCLLFDVWSASSAYSFLKLWFFFNIIFTVWALSFCVLLCFFGMFHAFVLFFSGMSQAFFGMFICVAECLKRFVGSDCVP